MTPDPKFVFIVLVIDTAIPRASAVTRCEVPGLQTISDGGSVSEMLYSRVQSVRIVLITWECVQIGYLASDFGGCGLFEHIGLISLKAVNI